MNEPIKTHEIATASLLLIVFMIVIMALFAGCNRVGFSVEPDGYAIADNSWGVRVYTEADTVTAIYFEADTEPVRWQVIQGTNPEGWPYVLLEREK